MGGAGVRTFLDGRDGGVPLPNALRRVAERMLGDDFGGVRVKRSSEVELLGVSAVTFGETVIVHPELWGGFDHRHTLHLLTHELTHVAQQRAGRVLFSLASSWTA